MTSVFVCQLPSISISRSLYFDSFSTTLMEEFLFYHFDGGVPADGMATSTRVQVLSLLFLTMMSGQLADVTLVDGYVPQDGDIVLFHCCCWGRGHTICQQYLYCTPSRSLEVSCGDLVGYILSYL